MIIPPFLIKPFASLAMKGAALIGACAALAFGVGYAMSQARGFHQEIYAAGWEGATAAQQAAILEAQEEARTAREEVDAARETARAEFDEQSRASRAVFEQQLNKARSENATLDTCLSMPPIPLGLRPQTLAARSIRD